VHGQEYVFDAQSTAAIGVGNLEAIRRGVRGYAAGGFVGSTTGAATGGGSPSIVATAGDFDILRGSLKGLIEATRDSEDVLGSLGDFVQDKLQSFLEGILDKMLSTIEENLINAFKGLASGGGGGGGGGFTSLFSGMFGGGGGGGTDWASLLLSGAGGLFSSGDWTGPGGEFEPAGIVHRDEFVFNKKATNAIGVNNLRSLMSAANNGFAGGGFTGGSASSSGSFGGFGKTSIQFINNGTPQRVTEEREEDEGRGGRKTVYVLEDMIANTLRRPGSPARRALGSDFGIAGKVKQR
jgi:hypothetical protein